MTKIKNPLFSLGAVGRLAKDLVFTRRRKTDIVEKKPVLLDIKSLLQISWRHMYQKASLLWHALSASEKAEWESLARRKHMTGYAYFISQALRPNPGLYLPLQGGTMVGDIDMDSNRILNLIDPTTDQEPATKKYHDDNPGATQMHGADKHTDITRWFFIPANAGDREQGSDDPLGNTYGAVKGSANSGQPQVYFTIKVPDDFVSFASVKAIWSSVAAAGNMWWKFKAQYGAVGEVHQTHTDYPAYGASATGGTSIINASEGATPLTLSSLAIGDLLGVGFIRRGDLVEDTLDADVHLLGLLFTYTANQ